MLRLVAVVLGITLFAEPQFAGVIYSNLGPGQTFSSSTVGTIVPCPPPMFGPCPASYGQEFTPTASYTLDQIDIAGTTNFFSIHSLTLAADSGGLPGAAIESLQFAAGTDTLLVATSATHPLLLAGTTYWVWSGFVYGLDQWNLNSTGATGGRAIDVSSWASQGTSTQLAIEITGTAAVPEPASGLIAFLGLAALTLAKSRIFRV